MRKRAFPHGNGGKNYECSRYVAAAYILLSRPLILLFNQNPVIVDYERWLLISQVALYPAFGLCYMMTIT